MCCFQMGWGNQQDLLQLFHNQMRIDSPPRSLIWTISITHGWMLCPPLYYQHCTEWNALKNDVLKIKRRQHILVIIPLTDRVYPHKSIGLRRSLMMDFKKLILSPKSHGSGVTREQCYADGLASCCIMHNRKPCHKFNLVVTAYPERHCLTQVLLPAEVDYVLGVGNAVMYVELFGYGRKPTALLPSGWFPHIKAFVKWEHNAPFLDESLSFPKSKGILFSFLTWIKGFMCSVVILMLIFRYWWTNRRPPPTSPKG